jgi:acetyl-CoA synthetase
MSEQRLSLEQLVCCGLDETAVAKLLQQINSLVKLSFADSASSIECWQHCAREILKPDHPFALHQLLYKTVYADWDSDLGPPPVWSPSFDQIQSTNIAALMRSLNIDSYEALHAWSVQHRAEFWKAMIQRLGIQFQHPYTQTVDLSQGVEYPTWLVDARLNIVESCFQAPEHATAIVFLKDGLHHTWSYGELRSLTSRVANSIIDAGFKPGDAIAIALPMTPESVAIYLGIVAAGCVVVGIADSFAADEIATRLRITNAKAMFTQDVIHRAGKSIPLYAKVVAANAPQAIVLSAASTTSGNTLDVELRSGDVTWTEFLGNDNQFIPIAAESSAFTNILFSSGTTGDPKAIPWTQTTPIKCAADGHLHHDIHPGDVVAWYTNLGWMMGPWLIYASLINQAAIALYNDSPTQRGFGQFIQDARVTMLGVVPSLVNTWRTTHCMHGLDWSAIKAFSSTGECSNPDDMLFLMALAGYKPIVEYCGGTEIGGGYITGTLVQPCSPATFTTPALGLDVVILDHNDRPATKGEAFIIPPSIGLSTTLLNKDHHQVYFADTPLLGFPSASHPLSSEEFKIQNSKFKTSDQFKIQNSKFKSSQDLTLNIPLRRHGDQLERLPNGYYRALGRVDDTMNLAGIKVSSAEIERVLMTVDDVGEAVAIAISPPTGGPSQLIIYAVAEPECQKTTSELSAELQEAIARHLNPLFKIRDLVLVDALPRTASNKVMRRVLRDQYYINLAGMNGCSSPS